MKKSRKKAPELILKGGKPTAVIIDIDEYREMLERLEDLEDLKILREMAKKPIKYEKFDDVLKELDINV